MMAWVAFGALLAVALVICALSLLRSRPKGRWLRRDANLAIFRQRGSELRSDAAVTDERPLAVELDAALLDQTTSQDRTGSTKPIRAKYAWALAITMVVVTAGLYWYWGDPSARNLIDASALLAGDPTEEELNQLVVALQDRLKRRPDDLGSWVYLTNALYRLRRFEDVVNAHIAASQIGPVPPAMDIDRILSQVALNEGRIDQATFDLMESAKESQHSDPILMDLYWRYLTRHGDHSAAGMHLERALGQPLAEWHRSYLDELLAFSRSRLPEDRPAIRVQVRGLRTEPSMRWLTVFAREHDDQPPVVAVRRPLRGVDSATIHLDSTSRMMEGTVFSSPVVVTARLSPTSSVTLTKEDITVSSQTVDPTDNAGVVLSFSEWKDVPSQSIRVDVDRIDLAFSADTIVFVIASDPNSGGPPVAVRKMTWGELPLTIHLTDDDSMIRSRLLSSVESLSIVARVSSTGTALASAGDYVSRTEVVPFGGSTRLVIDRQYDATSTGDL